VHCHSQTAEEVRAKSIDNQIRMLYSSLPNNRKCRSKRPRPPASRPRAQGSLQPHGSSEPEPNPDASPSTIQIHCAKQIQSRMCLVRLSDMAMAKMGTAMGPRIPPRLWHDRESAALLSTPALKAISKMRSEMGLRLPQQSWGNLKELGRSLSTSVS
jgi:hypothetical protein